jgi:hypothetical protein
MTVGNFYNHLNTALLQACFGMSKRTVRVFCMAF